MDTFTQCLSKDKGHYGNSDLSTEICQWGLTPWKHKVLLLGEAIELKNRFLRIGFEYGSKGAVAVSNLRRKGEKLDIGAEKLDIDEFSQPTKANIKKLLEAYSTQPFFKRKDVLVILNLSPTAASDLLAKMLSQGIIEPVSGHGKGAYRFKV